VKLPVVPKNEAKVAVLPKVEPKAQSGGIWDDDEKSEVSEKPAPVKKAAAEPVKQAAAEPVKQVKEAPKGNAFWDNEDEEEEENIFTKKKPDVKSTPKIEPVKTESLLDDSVKTEARAVSQKVAIKETPAKKSAFDLTDSEEEEESDDLFGEKKSSEERKEHLYIFLL